MLNSREQNKRTKEEKPSKQTVILVNWKAPEGPSHRKAHQNLGRIRLHEVKFEICPKSSVGIPFKPLHPHISMHILSSVLYTFSEVQIRRICLSIRSLFNYNVLFRVILSGKIRCLFLLRF